MITLRQSIHDCDIPPLDAWGQSNQPNDCRNRGPLRNVFATENSSHLFVPTNTNLLRKVPYDPPRRIEMNMMFVPLQARIAI